MNRAAELAAFLREHRNRPFTWGTWDCGQIAASWVKCLTGVDHLASLAAYTDEAGAITIIDEHGGLAALVDSRLPPIHPSRARVGDLVMAGRDLALGICCGVDSAHVSPKGIVYRKTLESVRAWRVE